MEIKKTVYNIDFFKKMLFLTLIKVLGNLTTFYTQIP